ncbi:hypothetical protein HYV80_04820 [Candidatus Woesearchaeota archaeon]|nr:hypothetical protein [Candidatus Woesearchaeota archaeon]
MNSDIAYLLGMIVGKGTLVRDNDSTKVIVDIPHKNLEIEGMEAQLSVEASINRIKERIEPLLEVRISTNSQKSLTTISFQKNNQTFVIKELNKYLGHKYSCKDFRIPELVFELSNDLKVEFLRGLSDVTAHIRSSNNAYGYSFGHRSYIEIPQNWFLVIDICNLLKSLDVPVQNIDWGHPNIRDPNLEEYNAGRTKAWFREHQIKIFADEFEKIGFYLIHKKRALKKLADLNRAEWDKYCKIKMKEAKSEKMKETWKKRIGNLKEVHHRFYWETKTPNKPKPRHPEESSVNISSKIRGKHFDNWKDIAKELGYDE